MAKIKEVSGKKASDYFHVEGFKDGVLHLAIKLQKPSEENVSGTGETYVLGRAFGKIQFMVAGRPLKVNASIMLPLSDVEKARIKEQRAKTATEEKPAEQAVEIQL